jgi:hydroxymethylbilane synthase
MSLESMLRIGTRGSPLALIQANIVKKLILSHASHLEEDKVEIRTFTTQGDRLHQGKLVDVGGKGLFCKEIDHALLQGEVDIAVHSAKDMSTLLPEGIEIACTPMREDARDVFISDKVKHLKDLPHGAVLGTASLRRQAQVLSIRPDLKVEVLRGNVGTRLEKIKRGDADATLLALAGLKRLHQEEKAASILSIEEMIPAVGQGVLALCTRQGDQRTRAFLEPFHDEKTFQSLRAERALLKSLDGSCRTPIAGYAHFINEKILELTGLLADPEGKNICKIVQQGTNPEDLGQKVGQTLKAQFRSACI